MQIETIAPTTRLPTPIAPLADTLDGDDRPVAPAREREIEVDGARQCQPLLDELGMNRESHLVIRNGTLVPGDGRLDDDDVIEVRPVISGG